MKIKEDANENNKSTLPGLILAESIKQDYIDLHDMIKGPVVLQVLLIAIYLHSVSIMLELQHLAICISVVNVFIPN